MVRRDQAWENRAGGYIETTNPLGYDVLINGTDKYLNFNVISGSLGYGFRDSGGVMQFKDSGGAWTPFGSGAATSITIGIPVIGGTPKDVLYIDNSGNLFDDVDFSRDSGPTKQTQIIAYTYAQAIANDGVNNEVIFKADTVGDVGSTIALTANGTDDADTIIATRNGANPGNTVTLVSGVGTTVPTAGTIQLVGGGQAGMEEGTVDFGFGPFQGVMTANFDSVNSLSGFSIQGNLANIIGDSKVGTMSGGLNLNTGELAVMFAVPGQSNMIVTDQTTYQTQFHADDQGAEMSRNGVRFSVDATNGPGRGAGGGNQNYWFPLNVSPSIGDSLQVASIVGQDYYLDFATSGGGRNTFPVTLTDDMTAYSGNIVAGHVDAASPDYQCGFIFKTASQSTTGTGTSGSWVWTKSLKLNQKLNISISQSTTGLDIQAMRYDVVSGTWSGSRTGTAIVDPMDVTEPFDCQRIDNSHFVVGYITSSFELKYVTVRMDDNQPTVVDVYAVPTETYDKVRLTMANSVTEPPYRRISALAYNTNTGILERHNLAWHADWTINTITYFNTAITTQADTVNFQMKGEEFYGGTNIFYIEPTTGNAYIFDNSGATVISGGPFIGGVKSLNIVFIGTTSPNTQSWMISWNTNVFDAYASILTYDNIAVTFTASIQQQIFQVDPTYDQSFHSASLTSFINETTSSVQPNKVFAQRMVQTNVCETVALSMDYSTPGSPAFIVGTVNQETISDYDDTVGVISINNRRYEVFADNSRNFYLMSFDYLANVAPQNPERFIRMFNSITNTWENTTRRKQINAYANCLLIPDGSFTIGATVTAYGPGAEIPVSSGVDRGYLGPDGLQCNNGAITDIIAYDRYSLTSAIVKLVPFVPTELDCYAGPAYPNEGVGLYKSYNGANSIAPSMTYAGMSSYDIKITNMATNYNTQLYIPNENNLGFTTDTASGPRHMTNQNDYVLLRPTTDIVDPGFDVIEDGCTDFYTTIDMSNSTYFYSDTICVPYFWKTKGTIYTQNTGTGTTYTYIKTAEPTEGTTTIRVSALDGDITPVYTSLITSGNNLLRGPNITSPAFVGGSNKTGDWIEFARVPGQTNWFKQNAEIFNRT